MTSGSLARSYLKKAQDRLEILDVLLRKGAYSDVVREAQEVVELALKAMLRSVGIEPPKVHDVGSFLKDHRSRFGPGVSDRIDRLAEISKELRKDRELSFYGDLDFIPTEEYDVDDAQKAHDGAYYVVETAGMVVPEAL